LQRFQAELFPYFFALYPGAQRLFNQDKLSKQSAAFVQMLYWIVENMETPNLGAVLSQLGMLPLLLSLCSFRGGRHAIYNVIEEEYGFMTQALIQTVTNILGDSVLTPETQQAWKEVMTQFSHHMIAAGMLPLACSVTDS
jgi:hemoglobin-like flavoprotein